MNRFRKSKKVKEARQEAESIPPVPVVPIQVIPKLPKKHKPEPEPEPEDRPEFNLDNALPSSDDFRTSLIMPKLSARFSMLREQDDPASKMGKANDDSVLFPKRASRLNLFGHNPTSPGLLADIAEVSSLRPSFDSGRAGSFASSRDDETDYNKAPGGSIMSRARPGEGNNLFGGRQKVYKIPVKSNESGGSGGLKGRTLYDDDVTLSTFQRLRLEEKENRLAETMESLQGPSAGDSSELSSIHSIKRTTTTSSTASGPSNGRTSTAATSIDEQPSTTSAEPSQPTSSAAPTIPERPKPRRLYGQGLEQSQNKKSPAFAAISKFENLSRQRMGNLETPPLNRHFSRSAHNLRDRMQTSSPVQANSTHENTPPPSATSPGLQSNRELGFEPTSASSTTGYGVIPPLSPPVSENEDASILAAAMQPEDKGKATAMGLFNKPNSKYDEQQFTRRQLQMHEGRNTPDLRQESSRGEAQVPDDKRGRRFSNASKHSKTESVSSRYSVNRTGSNSPAPSGREAGPLASTGATFFANSSGSESESEDDEDRGPSRKPSSQALDDVHPALRPSSTGSVEDEADTSVQESSILLPEVRFSDFRDLNPITETSETDAVAPTIVEEESSEKALDSPTLGPSGLGLSGLVRTHLRHDSDKSSIYPLPQSPGLPSTDPARYRESIIDPAVQGFRLSYATYTDCIQEDDEMDNDYGAVQETLDKISQPSENQGMSSMSMRAKQMLEQAAALRGPNEDNGKQDECHPAWQEELNSKPRRRDSADTDMEREEFANELAERRRKVQEKLRDFAETESRSGSPAPGRSTPDLRGNPLAALKNRSSKKTDSAHSKNSKIFGNRSRATSVSSVVSDVENDEQSPYELGRHSNGSTGKNMWQKARTLRRYSRDESRNSSPNRGPSPPSRPESDASGRLKSGARGRDDLEKVDEDFVSQHTSRSSGEASGNRTSDSMTHPSVDAASVTSGRYFSGNISGKLDVNSPGEPPELGLSPRPSPAAPYSANTTPPLHEMSSDSSAASTPGSLQPGSHAVPQRAPGSSGLQKRAVNKLQISEPTLVSSTYRVPTVNLPPGASLTNGMDTPPVPPMNPRRRRQTATQTILGALKGEKNEQPPLPPSNHSEERSTFSDEGERFPKVLNRLRNISSEGSSLHGKARKDSATPQQSPNSLRPGGGMF
ncbi:conserved hypothetical protein [Paecilomyces variotii No. 5]|uniref:Uncharacterized protein n=1 Tax=Byssochlamys spectabilis (strain No. 5 / NBRC 109023) TaxID=1356009 RepID=V5HVK2_BYSSN|nr:conserved hypothetical protein [Paecilomyces variotii No. 5]